MLLCQHWVIVRIPLPSSYVIVCLYAPDQRSGPLFLVLLNRPLSNCQKHNLNLYLQSERDFSEIVTLFSCSGIFCACVSEIIYVKFVAACLSSIGSCNYPVSIWDDQDIKHLPCRRPVFLRRL